MQTATEQTEQAKPFFTKFAPCAWVIGCDEKLEAGDIVTVETKRGKRVECTIYKRMGWSKRKGVFLHSYTRADGITNEQVALNKAERRRQWQQSREDKSDGTFQRADEIFSPLKGLMGQPILVGHHSEKRHRKLLDNHDSAMRKAFEHKDEAKKHEWKAEYWERQAEKIDLSQPKSLAQFNDLLEVAEETHTANKQKSRELKKATKGIERGHNVPEWDAYWSAKVSQDCSARALKNSKRKGGHRHHSVGNS